MLMSIRRGVWETNSSSTHSITICSPEQWNDFQNGDLYLFDDEVLMTMEEIEQKYKEYMEEHKDRKGLPKDIEQFKRWFDVQTYDEWVDEDYLESYDEEYITPKGEKIICFGKYGRDG